MTQIELQVLTLKLRALSLLIKYLEKKLNEDGKN